MGELKHSGEFGQALVRRAATLSVRMEWYVAREYASLTQRVRRAIAEFEAPEGVDEGKAARLREEAGQMAMFDSFPEATLLRKYEASAERGFFRAIKELRQVERQAKADDPDRDIAYLRAMMGSILNSEKENAEFDALVAGAGSPHDPLPASPAAPVEFLTLGGRAEVPSTISRRR